MNLKENWLRWEPISNLDGKYNLEFISNVNEFTLLLSQVKNKDKKVKLSFNKSVEAYRVTYESFRQNLINQLTEKYGSEFYSCWAFFKVYNSKYIEWLSEESSGYSDYINLKHFSIFTGEFIIDIIDLFEPTVEIINE